MEEEAFSPLSSLSPFVLYKLYSADFILPPCRDFFGWRWVVYLRATFTGAICTLLLAGSTAASVEVL